MYLYKTKNGVSIIHSLNTKLRLGEVKIKVLYAGICKTDVFMANNTIKNSNVVLGHEGSGVIIESLSEDFSVGDSVVWNPYLGNDLFLGINRNGCFSDDLVLNSSSVYKHSIKTPQIAAYIEPVAVSMAPIKTGITKKERGLVKGNSRISNLTYDILKSMGYNISKDECVCGYDYIIETNETDESVKSSIQSLKFGGKLIFKSRNKKNINIDIQKIVKKEIEIKGVYYMDFNKALEWLQENEDIIENYIGKEYRLDQWDKALKESLNADKKGFFKL
jgi:threonine dehydrogenase-like Zn-dependent dehydrogenase